MAGWKDRANLDFGWPGGETRRAFRDRCLRAIAEIVAHHEPYDNIIVVTHGGVIRAYLTAPALDDPMGPRSYEADNCSITHIQFMGRRRGRQRRDLVGRLPARLQPGGRTCTAGRGRTGAATHADLALQFSTGGIPMYLFLIRHGQSEGNVAGAPGLAGSPADPAGRAPGRRARRRP